MRYIMKLNHVEICIYCFVFCVLSLYFYVFYVFFWDTTTEIKINVEKNAVITKKEIKITTNQRIVVAIPTHNRIGYVKLCAEALKNTTNDVWVFDDYSSEYTSKDLKKWFNTEHVYRNHKRFKADKQARYILEWFVGTDYDWAVTLDSDLIVDKHWLTKLRNILPNTQGIVSLYHSGNPNHPTGDCYNGLCEMKTLGNAGVVWSNKLARKMLLEMKKVHGFDWGWTEWLKKNNITQYAMEKSVVLHVGMHGTWGIDSKREKSMGFDMSRLTKSVRQKAEAFLNGAKPISIRNDFAIIIIADQNAQKKYKGNIENVKCYADHYQYTFIVTDVDSCKGHFFFKKHCTVRNLMDKHDFKWALVLDGDVAVVNFKRQLTEFVSDDLSVVHGIRFHNNEIMAGIYFIRNDNYGKKYIQDWVNSGYKGFNYDNGALHYHLLNKLAQGVSGKEECKKKGQYSRDLHSYDQFVKCVHEVLSRSSCERRVRIMENSETNPVWIAIDSDRPKGTWTSTSFLHHAMKAPHQLRKAPKCSRSYFEGQTDDWFVSEDEYKKNLKDFWINKKRRDTGFDFDLCNVL